LCQADQSLVDIAVHLQDGIALNIDIEHRAVDGFLAGRAPAAAGIDGIASAAKDIEGIRLVRQGEHVGRVQLHMDARTRIGAAIFQSCLERGVALEEKIRHHGVIPVLAPLPGAATALRFSAKCRRLPSFYLAPVTATTVWTRTYASSLPPPP